MRWRSSALRVGVRFVFSSCPPPRWGGSPPRRAETVWVSRGAPSSPQLVLAPSIGRASGSGRWALRCPPPPRPAGVCHVSDGDARRREWDRGEVTMKTSSVRPAPALASTRCSARPDGATSHPGLNAPVPGRVRHYASSRPSPFAQEKPGSQGLDFLPEAHSRPAAEAGLNPDSKPAFYPLSSQASLHPAAPLSLLLTLSLSLSPFLFSFSSPNLINLFVYLREGKGTHKREKGDGRGERITSRLHSRYRA